MRIKELHEYQALKKHMQDLMNDYDVDDIDKKRFEIYFANTDREVNDLLDRVELWRQKSRTLLQMYWSFWLNISQWGQNDMAQEDRTDDR